MQCRNRYRDLQRAWTHVRRKITIIKTKILIFEREFVRSKTCQTVLLKNIEDSLLQLKNMFLSVAFILSSMAFSGTAFAYEMN